MRRMLALSCLLVSQFAAAESYFGLTLGMSRAEVEARYGKLKPSSTSSYQNAFDLPASLSTSDLPNEIKNKPISEVNVYFDSNNKLWSIFIDTKNIPATAAYADAEALRKAYAARKLPVANRNLDPFSPVRNVTQECYFLSDQTDKSMRKHYGKEAWNAFSKRIKSMGAGDYQAWNLLCGNNGPQFEVYGAPKSVQTHIGLAANYLPAANSREDGFYLELDQLVKGQALEARLEFIIVKTTAQSPSFDAMRDQYRKPE